MAEPKGLIAPPTQPIGWPTHRYQHCLKTVMPSKSIGTNMTLHRNIPQELLPTSRYDKLPERWRAEVLPPLQQRTPNRDHKRVSDQNHAANRRADHLELRPPSAYSMSITFKREPGPRWAVNHKLDTARLRALMRENTFHPGNFSTLYKCPKQKVEEMVNRLSYDPYERREQLILTDNPDDVDTPMYTKSDVEAIVARLAATKPAPEEEPEPEKKPVSKELSVKEKEIVDRLSKYEHPADRKTEEPEEEKKTVTKAQLEEILARLTQKHVRKEPVLPQVEVKKVSSVDMENILTRLTTYDAQKWPPESKPEIYRLHARVD